MIAGPVQENLRLVFQAAKRARMNDSGTVALEFRSIRMARLWILAAVRFTRFLGERRQNARFVQLHLFAAFPTWPVVSHNADYSVAPPALRVWTCGLLTRASASCLYRLRAEKQMR